MAIRIAVLVGSLRKEAFSRKMAMALIALAPESLSLEIVEIGQLPLYNQDYDDQGQMPPEYAAFREQVKSFDAVLFVTPEHNRSVPAALKNALDVGSRPYRQNAWEGKPGAVVGVSPGAIGAFGANHHLRQSLVFVNVRAMPQPEAYIGGARGLFDAGGVLVDENVRDYLRNFMAAFARWIDANSCG
jgi:chromate reductase, NAD(P)H dehydrogenase (quinone)